VHTLAFETMYSTFFCSPSCYVLEQWKFQSLSDIICMPLHMQLVYYLIFGGVGMADVDEGKSA
jgi:hypothetical protein